MSIFKDTFKPEIKLQLEARQEALGTRGPTSIQYFNARNAWIRMTSSVNTYVGPSPATPEELAKEDNYNNILAQKHVLQGGILFPSINGLVPRVGVGVDAQAYSLTSPNGINNRLGIRPMPGITGIDVKSKSAYGSLREVTVNFVAWDIRQLEDLELLYMRPGYTVLIEWGWMPYLFADEAGNRSLRNNIDYYDIINSTPSKETIFKDLYDNAVKEYQGNYDAMFGYVKNYSWSARNDGGYDCTTTIISVGEVMESLKVNYSPFNDINNIITKGGLIAPRVEGMSASDVPNLDKEYSKNILAGLFYELYKIGQKKMKITDTGDNLVISDIVNGQNVYYDLFGKLLNVVGGEGDASSTGKIGASDEQIYITLEGLCNVINSYVTFKDSNGNNSFVKCSVLERSYLEPPTPNPLTGEGYMLCLAHPLQLSVDPTICVIKSPVWANGFKVNPSTIAPTQSTGSNLVRYTNDDVKLYENIITVINEEAKKLNSNEERVIQEMSKVLKGDINKIKELSRIWHSTPSNRFSLYATIFQFLSEKEIYKALGTAESSEILALIKKSPEIAEQEKLTEEKKKLEKTQSTAIENIQYVKNTKRPYFYQDNWSTELGIIGNIYVNLNYLYRLALDNNLEASDTKEKKDINLYDFLKTVLSEVAASTGNVNNFDLYVDPIDNNKIFIIDINYVDSKKRNEVYKGLFTLELQNLKSTARSYKLESQIYPDQSSTVAIGAQVGGGAMATDNNTMLDFNKGLIDRIIPKKIDPTVDPNKPDADKIKNQLQSVNSALQSLYDFFGKLDYSKISDANFDTNKASDYKNSLKDLINFFKNLTKSDIKNRAIIPTKFSATIDGIGGLVIGHLFRIPEELLPRGYQGETLGSRLGYAVTGIGHSIKDNDWTTDIEAQTIILDEPEGSGNFEDLIEIKEGGEIVTTDIKRSGKTGGATKIICGTVRKNGEVEDLLVNIQNDLYKRHYSSVNQSDNKRIRLQPNAMRDLEKLLTDAFNAGILIKVNSAYRTYEDQVRIKAAATNIPAAIPGTSNHGFGLAVDLANINGKRLNPNDTPKEWAWIQANKTKYGFENINNGDESHHYNYLKPGITC
jgi:hypothetical protein